MKKQPEIKIKQEEQPIVSNEERVLKLKNELEKLDKNENKIFFWILDAKDNPSGSVANIYVMAYTLKELGYNVSMLYQNEENDEFVGVSNFIGKKYMTIPHYNIKHEQVIVNVSDILIIPELFSNLMEQTKNMPCKRIILCQNFNFIPEIMPIAVEWGQKGVLDVITTSEVQKRLLLEIMPYLKIKLIQPSIAPYFYKPKSSEKNLQVSIVTKDRSDVNKIAKFFYLKYPLFKFLTFKHLNGLNQELFAEEIRSSIACVWVDRETNFGFTPLEAMRCGTIVIGLIPDEPTDWMLSENKKDMTDSIIWVANLNKIHTPIVSVVSSWMEDKVPENFAKNMLKFDNLFTRDEQKEQIILIFEEYIAERKQELKEVINIFNKKNNQNE
jgi:hypothetical protein